MDLFAVSVDPPETTRALRDKLDSDFTFLCDTEGELLDELGIRHRPQGRMAELPESIAFPTAILVDENGIVRWAYRSDTYRQRARPEQIFQAIAELRSSS